MTDESVRGRVSTWILLEGNRFVVAGGVALGIALLVYVLAVANVVTLGPASNVRTLLSSGVTSGLLTLVTVTLSINQLLLSRVFGPPEEFVDRLSGTNEFRERTARAADEPLYQNEPKEFLLAVVRALRKRAEQFEAELPEDAPDELVACPDELAEYADSIAEAIESEPRMGESETMDVMATILGPEYAYGLTKVGRFEQEYGSELPDAARAELEAVHELLESVAVFRQFVKTLAVQQDLARLSRLIAYSGVLAVATTFVLALVYTSSSGATLAPELLRPVVSLGLGVVVLPLTILVSYIVRVATISLYTVSAGSFVPPEETFQKQ